MTRIASTLALAFTLCAVAAGTAHAQDADVETLRAFCTQLESVQSPAVVDCFQAVADAESAESAEDANAVVQGFYGTESPYDFQHSIVDDAENGPTIFDGE